jgi:hypothetical protein
LSGASSETFSNPRSLPSMTHNVSNGNLLGRPQHAHFREEFSTGQSRRSLSLRPLITHKHLNGCYRGRSLASRWNGEHHRVSRSRFLPPFITHKDFNGKRWIGTQGGVSLAHASTVRSSYYQSSRRQYQIYTDCISTLTRVDSFGVLQQSEPFYPQCWSFRRES